MSRVAKMIWNVLDFSAPHAQEVHQFLTRMMGRGQPFESVSQMLAEAAQLEPSLAAPGPAAARAAEPRTAERPKKRWKWGLHAAEQPAR
jgi:hypothetical protein